MASGFKLKLFLLPLIARSHAGSHTAVKHTQTLHGYAERDPVSHFIVGIVIGKFKFQTIALRKLAQIGIRGQCHNFLCGCRSFFFFLFRRLRCGSFLRSYDFAFFRLQRYVTAFRRHILRFLSASAQNKEHRHCYNGNGSEQNTFSSCHSTLLLLVN